MVMARLVDTPECAGEVSWQAVAPVLARVMVKLSVPAMVRFSWLLAFKSTDTGLAKADSGKFMKTTAVMMRAIVALWNFLVSLVIFVLRTVTHDCKGHSFIFSCPLFCPLRFLLYNHASIKDA